MEDFLKEMFKQAPSTAAVIAVVVIFIRYIGKRDEVWRDLHTEHLEARKESRRSIDANTEAMNRNTESNHTLAAQLTNIKSICPYGQLNPPPSRPQ